MVSEQSKRNLDLTFHRAARESLLRDAADGCEIEAVADGKPFDRLGESVFLITICSFAFRLMAIFDVADGPAARAYYCNGMVERRVEEAFAEIVNLCGGSLSRELASSFPHLGMSIPYMLNSRCMEFIGELKPHSLSRFVITIQDSVKLHATLCMHCCAEVVVAAPSESASTVSGALELF